MNDFFKKNLEFFTSKERAKLFQGIKRGFEKESLRVDLNGNLAETQHPKDLGASLTHPFITTDYSEALLEFITPPTAHLVEPFIGLTELHKFTYDILKDEMLWAFSMPCFLPPEEKIPIAQYGVSNVGKLKHIYRKGLGKRYGRRMQTIAGIHYNFSFSEAFFKNLYALYYPESSLNSTKPSLKDFISGSYLALLRNSLRWSFLLPLLFGASPMVSRNFLDPQAKTAEKLIPLNDDTFYGPYATSLRLSDVGYHNKADPGMLVSYNSFPEFLQTMYSAVHTQDKNFKTIGIKVGEEYEQLNDTILQSEDEHYALVRPKRVSLMEERTISALMRDGIEYIEIRALDINPFLPIGIEPRTLFILDAFLVTCLFLESPPIENREMARIQQNLFKVATEGRNPDVQIENDDGKKENLLECARGFLELMLKSAKLLDEGYRINNFTLACLSAKNALENQELLPSTRIIQELQSSHKKSYYDLIKHWSLNHKSYFDHLQFPPKMVEYYRSLAETSHIKQAALEKEDILPFSEFLAKFLAP